MIVTQDTLVVSVAGDEPLTYRSMNADGSFADLTNTTVRLHIDGLPGATLVASVAPGDSTTCFFSITALWAQSLGKRERQFEVIETDDVLGVSSPPWWSGTITTEDFSV